MYKIGLFLIGILFTLPLFAEINFSAQRNPEVDYRHYLKSKKSFLNSTTQITPQLTINDIPYFATYQELQDAFEFVRDRKTHHWLKMPAATRRTTFLYPQDGCFLRATLMNRALLTQYVLPLPKIYVFGNLEAASVYEKNKKIFWYFHVALAARINSTIYVLDPSLHFNHPLLLSEWLQLMNVSETTAEIRLCDSNSYSPFDRCIGSDGSMEEKFRENHLQYYLGVEWTNLTKLGLNPYELLGDNPPWK